MKCTAWGCDDEATHEMRMPNGDAAPCCAECLGHPATRPDGGWRRLGETDWRSADCTCPHCDGDCVVDDENGECQNCPECGGGGQVKS